MKAFAVGAASLLLSSCAFTSGLTGEEPLSQIEKARETEVESTLLDVWQAETTHYLENGVFVTNLSELGVSPPEDVAVSFTQITQDDFCAQATHVDEPGMIMHITKSSSAPVPGPCPV